MEKNVAMYIVFSRRQDFAEYFNDFFLKKNLKFRKRCIIENAGGLAV